LNSFENFKEMFGSEQKVANSGPRNRMDRSSHPDHLFLLLSGDPVFKKEGKKKN
jgi:hypothetical protein